MTMKILFNFTKWSLFLCAQFLFCAKKLQTFFVWNDRIFYACMNVHKKKCLFKIQLFQFFPPPFLFLLNFPINDLQNKELVDKICSLKDLSFFGTQATLIALFFFFSLEFSQIVPAFWGAKNLDLLAHTMVEIIFRGTNIMCFCLNVACMVCCFHREGRGTLRPAVLRYFCSCIHAPRWAMSSSAGEACGTFAAYQNIIY